MACKEGRPQVLKLLAGTMDELNCMELFTHTIASIEEQLKGISSPSPPKSLDCLMSVAYYLFFVDSAVVMSLIVRITSKFPKASLKLLSEFSKQNQHENTLVLTEISLVSIPIQWVERAPLTQIKLNHNLLISVPDAMFQIATLQRLDISHNSLDAIPSVLKWNCPKLKELNVSYNRLLSVPYEILEGQKRRDFMGEMRRSQIDANLPSIGKQSRVITAAQALYNLTGYNLYPCLCSISKVNISHNPSLTQVATSTGLSGN